MAKKYRNYCFTLNNYTDTEYDDLTKLPCQYIILAKEVGESGTKHIQGYVEFSQRMYLTAIKKFNNRIHWEPRKGTQKQAIDYCKKENNYIEVGSCKKQGTRTDLNQLCEKIIKNEIDKNDVIREHPVLYVNYHNGLDKILANIENSQNVNYEIIDIFYEEDEDIQKLIELKNKCSGNLFVCNEWDWNSYNNEASVAIYYTLKYKRNIELLINGLLTKVNVKYGVKNIIAKNIYLLKRKM